MNKDQPHIQIQPRRPFVQQDLDELVGRAHAHNASEQWVYGNCQVERCFFYPEVVQDIDTWATNSLESSPVAETGGFLLGNYAMTPIDSYILAVQHFLPAEHISFQSSHRLRMGPASMLALDKAQLAYPAQLVLGWFHTHPGHTPFFSEIDLGTHEAFFKMPYHIGVVMDPCQETYPTAIFARREDETMVTHWNPIEWIKWEDLRN